MRFIINWITGISFAGGLCLAGANSEPFCWWINFAGLAVMGLAAFVAKKVAPASEARISG